MGGWQEGQWANGVIGNLHCGIYLSVSSRWRYVLARYIEGRRRRFERKEGGGGERERARERARGNGRECGMECPVVKEGILVHNYRFSCSLSWYNSR